MVPCERSREDDAGVPWVERNDSGSDLIDKTSNGGVPGSAL